MPSSSQHPKLYTGEMCDVICYFFKFKKHLKDGQTDAGSMSLTL